MWCRKGPLCYSSPAQLYLWATKSSTTGVRNSVPWTLGTSSGRGKGSLGICKLQLSFKSTMVDAVPLSKSSSSQEWGEAHSCVNGETTAILACSHCYNKTPYTGRLKQQALISHGSGDWKSKVKPQQMQALKRILFPVYTPLCCVLTWPKSWISCLLLFQDTNSIMRTPPSLPHLTRISSQRLHLQITSHWG